MQYTHAIFYYILDIFSKRSKTKARDKETVYAVHLEGDTYTGPVKNIGLWKGGVSHLVGLVVVVHAHHVDSN